LSFVYERPDADIVDGDWRDEAEGQTLYDNLDDTSPEGTISGEVVLLLHAEGVDGSTTFTDSSANAHSITANGNVQVDTAQFKFGTASALFDGTGDYLLTPDHADFTFGLGDYTIDFWMRLDTSPNAFEFLIDFRASGGEAALQIYWADSDDKLHVRRDGSTEFLTGTSTLSLSTWYHVALTRFRGTNYLFLNGVLEDDDNQAINFIDFNLINPVFIGSEVGGGNYFKGWLDEIHIVKGEALYITAFQVPTSPYADGPEDYIISSPNPANDMCRIRLSDQSATTPATVRYQYGRRGQIETDLTVRLKQGTTVIQEWFHADIREGLYTASQTLDASAFALITDASDLSMEFEATEPWWL
jgi:hypothetical protein